MNTPTANRHSPFAYHKWLFAAVMVLLVAAALRFAAFGQVPQGIYHDEAYNGLDAVQVLQGNLSLYFPANNGREPLFIYLVALSIGVLGKSPFALRLPSLFAGIVTVSATAAMGRALFSRRIGALGAAVLAVTLWHVHLSRIGFRAVLLPTFTALAAWQAAMGCKGAGKRGSSWRWWGHWVAAGVFYGLSFYTYTAARFTPIALAAFGAYAWATKPQIRGTQHVTRISLALFAALVTSIPLIVYTIGHPDVALGRPEQVSFLNPTIHGGDPWGALGSGIVRALGMFFVRGDRIWRHNVPWRPVFDPLLGAAFVVGLLVAVRRVVRRSAAAGFVLIWTAVMILPTALAEDAPHFLRAVGVLPVAAMLPALGLDWLVRRIGEPARVRRGPRPELGGKSPVGRWPLVVASLFVAFGLVSTVRAYFGHYANDPITGYWFEHGATELAGRVNAFLGVGWDGERVAHGDPADRQVYLDRRLWEEWPQVRFLVEAPDAVVVGLEPITPQPPSVAVFTWPYGDWRRAWSLLPAPTQVSAEKGPLSQGDRDAQPYETYLAFYAASPSAAPAVARFSGGVELLGVEVEEQSGFLRVRLSWRATASLAEDYTVFLHYLRDGERIAQSDSRPADGLYPTTAWRPGDVVVDDHSITGVDALYPEHDTLLFGFWQPESGAKLYLLDEAGNPVGDWIETPID